MIGDERREDEHKGQREQNADPGQISRAGMAIEAFGKTWGISGLGPERLGNNERLGRRGNFIARSGDRCVRRGWEIEEEEEGGEKEGGRVGDLSNFRNTRALGSVEPDASISLQFLSVLLFFRLHLTSHSDHPRLPSQFDTLSRLYRPFPLVSSSTGSYLVMIPDFATPGRYFSKVRVLKRDKSLD